MYVTDYFPPAKRQAFVEGGVERRLTEPAVMLAYAMHLLEGSSGPAQVLVHPDGEHAKTFDIPGFLTAQGFVRTRAVGSTPYGGHYEREGHVIVINPSSGRGDVVGQIGGERVIAECKGGVINTRHSGQKSRLRKGLSELIGQLMMLPEPVGERQVAVLPETEETARLSARLAERCARAGIELALVSELGAVRYVNPG